MTNVTFKGLNSFLPLLLFLSQLLFSVFIFNSYSFYTFEFQKHNIYHEFSESPQTINQQALSIIYYLRGQIDSLDAVFFSERARIHMQDVKTIFIWMQWLLYVTGFLSFISFFHLIYQKKIKELGKQLIWSGFLSIGFVLVISLIAFTFWDWAFVAFHHLMFTNDYWLLDPSDNLIKMMPAEFFQDMVRWIGLGIVGLGIVNMVIGWYILKFCELYVTFGAVSKHYEGDQHGPKTKKENSPGGR